MMCCGPRRRPLEHGDGRPASPPQRRGSMAEGKAMVALPGGKFLMGDDRGIGPDGDGEGPVREVYIAPFKIDTTTVTNAEFGRFVEATGYKTEAERFGWSFVFQDLLPPQVQRAGGSGRAAETPWWVAVEGATWSAPFGPGSDLTGLHDHPVTHVSWNDASAFADYAGKRLPSEAEWEYAARGGIAKAIYPWGDELRPDGEHRCNIWQGSFPDSNTLDDGYEGTAPATEYEPNGFGLYNVSGNVWEWCQDWFSPTWHQPESPETRIQPTGPDCGAAKVMRGGSYLCHDSYCTRYRVAARAGNTPDSSTGHMGFRLAVS